MIERGDSGSTLLTHDPAGAYIVGRGGKPKVLDVGLRERGVFLELANAQPTMEGALSFTAKWGQLDFGEHQLLSEFLSVRESMNWSLQLSKAAQRKALWGHSYGSLMIDRDEKGRLVLRPHALVQFCWLERLHALDGWIDITQCQGCGAYLRLPHQKGRPKKTCSNACRQLVYRRKREDP